MNDPRVSVVIPCHDGEEHLGDTIVSVLRQGHAAHEIIVADDASTDGSAAIARAFGQPVRVLELARGGAPKARNRGAAAATGEALIFLDADDVLGPGTLRALVDALAEAPAGLAACRWLRLEPDPAGGWTPAPASVRSLRHGEDLLRAWLSGWYCPPCAVLWSRDAFERIGPWDEALVANQDGDMMMRALASGVPLVRTEAGAAFYRRARAGGASVSARRNSQEGLRSRMRVLDRVARILARDGTLDAYRQALGMAYDDLRRLVPPGDDELARALEGRARIHAGPRPLRVGLRLVDGALATARRVPRLLRDPIAVASRRLHRERR